MKKLLLLIAVPLWGTTYFVSNSGSDSANGTSQGTAWQTVARVNSQTFNPGDSTLFQDGGTWREELFVNQSGTAGNPITYGSYGSGSLPIISGANVLTSFTQVGSTHVWTKTVATQPNVLIFNGTPGVQQASSSTVTSVFTWSYSGTTLSVYSPAGDPSTLYSPLEAGQRGWAIIGTAMSYVTISGIRTQYANSSGIAFFGGGNHITVQNCVSNANYYFGITATNSTDNGNFTATGDTVSWNGSSGILVSGTGNNVLLSNNTAFNNAWGGSWTQDITFNTGTGVRMFGGGVMSNCIIQNNVAYNNGLGPTGIWNTQGQFQVTPDAEDGGGVMFDTMGTGNIMRNNVTYNNDVGGLRVTVDTGTLIYGNTSYGNVQTVGLAGYTGMGMDLDFGISGTQAYNNTIYGNLIGVLVMGDVSASKKVLNLSFTNNISSGNTTYDLTATVGGNNDGTNGSGNVYTYNSFGTQSSTFIQWAAGTFFSTYASWESAAGNCGSGGCSRSLQTSPTFANTTSGDFRLPRGAAALTAGSSAGVIGALGVIGPTQAAGLSSSAGVVSLQ